LDVGVVMEHPFQLGEEGVGPGVGEKAGGHDVQGFPAQPMPMMRVP
jgi:hypothetical protein